MSGNLSVEILEMLEESRKIYTSFPKKAYDISEGAYKLATRNNMKFEMASSLIMMAQSCSIMSEPTNVHAFAYDAYEIYLEIDDRLGMAKALNLVGIAYLYRSMYEQAANTLIKGLSLIEAKDDYKIYAALINNIGEILKEAENYDEAIEYYDKGIELCERAEIPKLERSILENYKATMLDNKGDICLIRGEYEEATIYFNESNKILEKEKDPIHLSESENRIGKSYYYNDDFEKAELYFEKAINRLEKVDNKFYAIDVLINISKLNFEKDQRKSFNSLQKAIDYAEKTNSKKKMSEIYSLAANHYEKTDNYKIALEYFKKHHFTEQEIRTSTISDKLQLIKMEISRLDVDETMDEVMLLNKQLESEISYQKHELEKIQSLNENLEKRVFKDSLTQIPNRNYLDYHLVEFLNTSSLDKDTIVLFMIDIDYFKKYNDYWGHLKGDDCLKAVAKVLMNNAKIRGNVLGRYGGEEFIYCSKVKNYKEAFELGDLLRKEVMDLNFRYSVEDEENFLTISLGGVLVKASEEITIFDIIEVADRELYKGKDSGRNIVMIKEI